ncbi:DOPA 4,5-dioxygenase family protein [uncultured Endozoicomonas sp.]|uniref:DOPA 4,5-dioxygenase family protein n=1 Tax=uncultured Endozoicomonas sp. TaxID=432652 RepID=UPI00262F83AB|nr:DOPA 4,5-dioxygenase family protein [uncultured Endozoicomonas sp.]
MPAIHGYHAHIYFDVKEAEKAETLCKAAGEKFPLRVGIMHLQPVGPHPRGSCQLAFKNSLMGDMLPWLIENRNGLTILLHTLTGDDYLDHTDNAFWLGTAEPLNLDGL